MRFYLKSKLDNRGSGIVTVLICILFLTVLGTMVLMAAYTGYEMKISEAKGRQNVYNAETALGEIRAGFQDVCSEAVGGALTDYLVTTGSYAEFVDSYINTVKTWVVEDYEDHQITYEGADQVEHKLTLFKTATASGGLYNPEALAAMIRNCRAGTIYLNTYGATASETPSNFNDRVIIRQGPQYENPSVVVYTDAENPENDRILFENISITFRTDGGTAENTISTDIEMKIPADNLPSGESGTRVDGLRDFSLISAKSIKQTEENSISYSTISGKTYSDSIEVSRDNMLVFLENSQAIVRNDLDVKGSSTVIGKRRVEFSSGSKLWARNIIVDKGSLAASRNSNFYIANDLVLKGKADVYTEGRYIGFGGDEQDADKSSAILFNGSKCTFYVNSVEGGKLQLGGLAFIGNKVSPKKDFMSGQSIMVKKTQVAYIIDDVECLKPESYKDSDSGDTKISKTIRHNPIVVSSLDGYENYRLDTNKVVFKYKNEAGEDVTRTYADYNLSDEPILIPDANNPGEYINNPNAPIKMHIMPRGENQYMIYFFLSFPDKESARSYYTDYYYANRSKIDDLISEYKATYRITDTKEDFYFGDGLKEVNGKTITEISEETAPDNSYLMSLFDYLVRYLREYKPSDFLNPQNDTKAYSSFTYDELYPGNYVTYSMHDYCEEYELSEVNSETGETVLKDEYDNPYYYMVDLQNLRRIPQSTKKYYTYKGKNIAVVCRGDYTYPQDFNDPGRDIKFILCEGNITISNDENTPDGDPVFKGIIMASGDISLEDTVSIESSGETLYKAVNSVGSNESDVFSQYFRVQLVETFDFGEVGLDEGDYSVVFQLVNYVNWKKD